MQNIPDKGVSGTSHYLQAEYTVTGLSGSLPGVKRRIGETLQGLPFWEAGPSGKALCGVDQVKGRSPNA